MNKSALYKILKAADNADGDVYAPSAFTHETYIKLKQKIQVVKQEIELLIGQKLVSDGKVQDASFIDQLGIYRGVVTSEHSGITMIAEFAIMFSKFSNLTMIWGYNKSILINYPIKKIINILEYHGFIYIPPEILAEKYTGRHEFLSGRTWGDRFFDYM